MLLEDDIGGNVLLMRLEVLLMRCVVDEMSC